MQHGLEQELLITGKRPIQRYGSFTLFSKQPTHNSLFEKFSQNQFSSFKNGSREIVIRFGVVRGEHSSNALVINPLEGCINAANKGRTKNILGREGFSVLPNLDPNMCTKHSDFPIIAKQHYGTQNRNNTYITSRDQLITYINNNPKGSYYLEKHIGNNFEFRVHVSRQNGCFYLLEKRHAADVPISQKWYKNDENCKWITENTLINNYAEVVSKGIVQRVKDTVYDAAEFIGLDLCACDVIYDRMEDEVYILEINSAPSFGEITTRHYSGQIFTILKKHY